jgi:hypothetical protein
MIGIDLESLFHYHFLDGKYTSPKKENTHVKKIHTVAFKSFLTANQLVIFEASETVRKSPIPELIPTNHKNDLFLETGNRMA